MNDQAKDAAQPQKLSLHSAVPADEKLRQLQQLFPEAFTENQTINFERLKTALGQFPETHDQPRERYGLTWPGKNECLKIIQQASTATLKPRRKESVRFDDSENLFIEGDNLEALKLLQKAYYGKVKAIYIDPPYNTGNEFVYSDKFADPIETYLQYTGQLDENGRKNSTNGETNGRHHSNWLSMMYPRLYLARQLLAEDGVIFISIDDNEMPGLRLLCDEIFGEENRLDRGLIVWPNKGSTKGFRKIVKNHEYILAYGKNAEAVESCFCKNFQAKEEIAERLQTKRSPRNPIAKVRFPKGLRIETKETVHFPGPISPGTNQIDVHEGNLRFVDGKLAEDVVLEASYPSKKQLEDFLERLGTDEATYDTKGQRWLEVYFTKTGVPYHRKRREVKVISSMLENVTNSGLRDLISLGGDLSVDYPKPVGLIFELLSYFTSNNDIVLDFFAGSCTTAHAVMKLNKEDGGNRRFIMVQLPEPYPKNSESFKAGFKTIADVGKERIRRAAAKLDDESGFKVFRLDRSNFKVWDNAPPKNVKELQKRLEMHVNHLNPQSSKEDILYEILLKAGHPLTTRIEKKEMAGTKIYSVNNGKLFLCLEKLTLKAVHAMAKAEPQEVICLDSCFAGNDELKTNAYYYFKCRSTVPGDYPEILFRTV